MRHTDTQQDTFLLTIKLVHAPKCHSQTIQCTEILNNCVLLQCHIYDDT